MDGGRRAQEFSEFVSARRRHLRRFAYLLCSDWHHAEDLVQTALTKLYVAWPRIRQEGTEEAYARQTLLRCHLDERRRPWRRESVTAELPESALPGGLSFEDGDQLRAAIRSLPDRQRAAVVLRYWWGLSLEETAQDLGCSVGTIKSQTSRAVDRLRAALAEDLRTG
ncbi:SigE family RNA polymerase sigma factor [Actinopolymorpha alba]|uniref:SigE family RNA polymerase sigma factor n=1 Tax=Actinopolymorpha alba TaxID=533267 RepID=UPI00036BBBF2|nr:SigE family RNA polymerase sigma factor [Actinopolymorpha alba]